MIKLMKEYGGHVNVNGKDFDSVTDAINAFEDYEGPLTILVNKKEPQETFVVKSDMLIETPKVRRKSIYKWIRRQN